ncbi:hypothetical protein GN956_G26702 [Arapaima gigas]
MQVDLVPDFQLQGNSVGHVVIAVTRVHFIGNSHMLAVLMQTDIDVTENTSGRTELPQNNSVKKMLGGGQRQVWIQTVHPEPDLPNPRPKQDKDSKNWNPGVV